MAQVQIEERGDIAVLRLTNGVTNAIGPEMIRDLSGAVAQIRENFHGMVLAGGEKFFSMGFDLPNLLTLDRQGMADFFYGFNDACMAIYTLPMPTVFAAAGHAVAGGHILALACDYRLAAEGKTKFGLNEVRLGVPVPYLSDLIQRQIVSDRSARQILYRGDLIPVADAVVMGLVDEVVAKDALEERAVAFVSELVALPAPAFAAIKENRVEAVREQYEKRYVKKNEAFLDLWLSPETQARLAEAAKKF
ncbi:MAG: enoyl-CoA hydratase/isomerase family protein [Desulfobacterales bacterium]|nr:enoyl-CoA hydratase/isomerase family protein [Desulfobacterales bacterium]